jgi:hypothetical protein
MGNPAPLMRPKLELLHAIIPQLSLAWYHGSLRILGSLHILGSLRILGSLHILGDGIMDLRHTRLPAPGHLGYDTL